MRSTKRPKKVVTSEEVRHRGKNFMNQARNEAASKAKKVEMAGQVKRATQELAKNDDWGAFS